MTAFSAGGRRAATCRPLNPPQDLPIIPTSPLHHGWEAIQAMASTASSCSWSAVLVDEHAVGVSAAPDVEPHSRIPVTGEVAEATLIVNGEQVVLAVRDVLENRRDRDGRGNLGHPDPRTEAGTVG